MDLVRLCDVLGIKPGASVAEVKQAYRDLVQVWHPDRFGQSSRLNTLATEKQKEINEAYGQLMALAAPTGYVPLPSRPAQRSNPAPPSPPSPTPPQPPPPPPTSQPPPQPQPSVSPVYPAAPTSQSKQPGKRHNFGPKALLLLVITCVLVYFLTSSLKDVFEYRYSDHPSALCGNWLWKSGDASRLTLYEDGTGFSVNAGVIYPR